MEIKLPELSLVVLVGVSGSGKSSFAARHFRATEIISSDTCRAIVSNDENDQSATKDAFELLNYMAAKRMKNGLLTVIDATNVQSESRKTLVELARQYHFIPAAIVLDLPASVCEERNDSRENRNFGNHVIKNQQQQLKRSLRYLKSEGFRYIFTFESVEEINNVSGIVRERLYSNRTEVHGPFDIIGDVHGCSSELKHLLEKLGYSIDESLPDENNFGFSILPPEGRIAIFLGDLVDRGPDAPGVLRMVMSMANSGAALCVPGNHDIKFQKYLNGRSVSIQHGMEETVKQFEKESESFKKTVKDFIYGLVSHYVLDDKKLLVSHAGLRQEMHGRGSAEVRNFCLYGETTGEIDEFGLPVRYNWAKEYRGLTKIVYGHTPVPQAEWLNNTINIDTGCVFGGKLTAYRYPENEIVPVDAAKIYCDPVRPLNLPDDKNELNSQHEQDEFLDVEDVLGKLFITTGLGRNITIREENAIAAFEVMNRYAVNPKWLIYLPPTMSPSETSSIEDYLEHPAEAIEYYRKRNVNKIVCEKKHMGSRAVLVVCRDEETAVKRFGIEDEGSGVCYTRTGRSFFNDDKLNAEFIKKVKEGLANSHFWEQFSTDWVCLDAELMPWSAKAMTLLKEQYAAVGAAAGAALPEVVRFLQAAVNSGNSEINRLLERYEEKERLIRKFVKSYQNYCWPVNTIKDYKLAPFHVLATEGCTWFHKNHLWHMENISAICKRNEDLFYATDYVSADISDAQETDAVINWWNDLTENGNEGMVVKPLDFIPRFKNEIIQPAIKCRGREYLRIIYGPEYTQPENLSRLKSRSLNRKRSLALREFALGVEGLERFVHKEPLRRIHECVFGVLALESEEVDPRL